MIKKTACIGAGLIGQSWATLFSAKGYDVFLQDINDEILEDARNKILINLDFLESNRMIIQGEAETAFKRIVTTTDIAEAVRDADYIQESVPDNYDLKKKVFRDMDSLAPDHTVLASSASGLMMSKIQSSVRKPERCVLAHPALPVHLIPLVEIVGGRLTSRETVEKAFEFMTKLGKTPVLLKKEVPGYIINRLQAALMREAIDLVDNGVADAEDIDMAFTMGIGLRDPFIGPFLRMHLAGNGIEKFIKNYSQSYTYRWESMATWGKIPDSAEASVIKSVSEMEIIRIKGLEELKSWRDEMLIKALRIIPNRLWETRY